MTTPILRFDKPTSRDIVGVNLQTLLGTRLLAQANSGGGKSWFIRALCEQAFGAAQIIVIDTEGEFATLREKFNYVLCGKDQDLPVHPKLAKALCRQLMEANASAVISVYDLKLHERREFVKLFLTELMTLPKSLWHPLLLVLDEAHVYAPQSGDSTATEAVVTLCTQGRKRGYAACLATQRMSKLHKDATAELLNRAIGRTGQDLDMKRAADELGMSRENMLSLRSLNAGEFHVFGPAFGTDVQLVKTANVLTTHPKAGSIGTFTPQVNASVEKMLLAIGDIPKIAAADEEKVVRLERQVRELQQQVRAKPQVVSSAPDQHALNQAEYRGEHSGIKIGAQREREFWQRKLVQMRKDIEHALRGSLSSFLAEWPGDLPAVDHIEQTLGRVSAPRSTEIAKQKRTPPNAQSAFPKMDTAKQGDSSLSGVQRRILDTLAGFAALGVIEPDKATVAAMCDYHPNAKSYSNAMGNLRTGGYITYPGGGRIALTELGHAKSSAKLRVSTHAELHDVWFAKLGGVAEKILAPLLAAYPDAVAADEVAAEAGYHPNAKSFSNMRGRLKTLGLIHYPSSGKLAATSMLFPEGLS